MEKPEAPERSVRLKVEENVLAEVSSFFAAIVGSGERRFGAAPFFYICRRRVEVRRRWSWISNGESSGVVDF
jgi:hypothetical protein